MARTSRKGLAKQTIALTSERKWSTGIYARLSVEDSGHKGADTIEVQIELVSNYVAQHTYLSLTDTYIDNGATGADFDRPAWNRLMDDVRANKINCIIVKDLSRFGRNYIETCELLENIFPFMNVRFISIVDSYDSEIASGHNEGLIIALKNLMNDQHLKDISRKIKASAKAKIKRGEYSAACAPFGYIKSKSHKNRFIPDEELKPIVKQIFEWRAKGLGQLAICKLLDEKGTPTPNAVRQNKYNIYKTEHYKTRVWSPSAIKRIVRNRVYLGYLELGKTTSALYEHKPLTYLPESEWHVIENAHEPIVSRELWEAANAVEQQRKEAFAERQRKELLPDNLFKGFLVCGVCGMKMSRTHHREPNKNGTVREYFDYFCAFYRQHPKNERSVRVRFETLEKVIFLLASEKLKMVGDLSSIIEKRTKSSVNPRVALDNEIANATHKLTAISQRLTGLYEDYIEKLFSESEYVNIKAEYERREKSLRDLVDELALRASEIANITSSDNRWLAAVREFQNPTQLTRDMLTAMIEKIVVYSRDKINVVWKFKDEFSQLQFFATTDGFSSELSLSRRV